MVHGRISPKMENIPRTKKGDNTPVKRNKRERLRVKKIRKAFENLEDNLPPYLKAGQMRQIDVLNATITYMNELNGILSSSEC